jgi:AcrR family transcriptional regulator
VRAFAERGYHGTSTRDIAAAAGMSPAALYVHHSSKEEVLYEIARRGHEDVLAAVRSVGDAADAAEHLYHAVYAFAEFHALRHTEARVINYELSALSTEHYATIHAARREIEAVFRGIIDRGMQAGLFDIADARMSVLAMTSLGVDIARWYHEDGLAAGEIASAYAGMALRIVGARPACTTPAAAGPAQERHQPSSAPGC